MPAMSGSSSAALRSGFTQVSLRSTRFDAFSRARSWRAISFCRFANVALPLLAIGSLPPSTFQGFRTRDFITAGAIDDVIERRVPRTPDSRLVYSTEGGGSFAPKARTHARSAPAEPSGLGNGIRIRLDRRASDRVVTV